MRVRRYGPRQMRWHIFSEKSMSQQRRVCAPRHPRRKWGWRRHPEHGGVRIVDVREWVRAHGGSLKVGP